MAQVINWCCRCFVYTGLISETNYFAAYVNWTLIGIIESKIIWATYMAASLNWGVLFVGVLMLRAPLFVAHIRAPDFWQLPDMTLERWRESGILDFLGRADFQVGQTVREVSILYIYSGCAVFKARLAGL